MKAWKEKEMVEKGTMEVLEKPFVTFEKPKLDRKELLSSISKVKSSDLELLSSSEVESGESVEFDDKINEIKAIARQARETEAGIELSEKEKRAGKTEMGENDEDVRMQSQNRLPHERLAHSLGVLAVVMINGNGATLDSGFAKHDIAASHGGKVSNVLPVVPIDGINHSSHISEETSSVMKNSNGPKSRVIRSVKEAKEFLSRRSSDGKELTQEPSQMIAEKFSKQSDEECGVASKCKLVDKTK